MLKSISLGITLLLLSFTALAQDTQPPGAASLKNGEVHHFDKVVLKKGNVLGYKNGVESSYPFEDCKYAVIAEVKKNKTVIKRQVLFAHSKTTRNLGGEAELQEGDAVFNIVIKNGNDMIIYKNMSVVGGGVGGNQQTYYHIKDGMVSKIEIQEWRDGGYIQSLIDDFGVCPETKKALQEFASSGKGSRQMKYEFFMQKLEKLYLLNCIDYSSN